MFERDDITQAGGREVKLTPKVIQNIIFMFEGYDIRMHIKIYQCMIYWILGGGEGGVKLEISKLLT